MFDDFSTGLRSNWSHHGNGIEIVDGSLTDPAAVERATRGVRTIYHLAILFSCAA